MSSERPFGILAAATVLSAVVLGGRWAYHRLENDHIQKDPLIIKGAQAIENIEKAISSTSTRQEIASALHKEIDMLFHPKQLEIALHNPQTNRYHISPTLTLAPNDPLVSWLTKQASNIPVVLDNNNLPKETKPAQEQMLERHIILIIPLGKQGWIGLGQPETAKAYDAAQLNLLQYLARQPSIGLERATIIEGQLTRAKELNSLFWIAQAVNFTMELDDLLELIYTQLRRVIKLPNFYVALKAPDQDYLSFAFYAKGDDRLYPDDVWAIDDSLTGTVLSNSMTLRTDNYHKECEKRHVTPKDHETGTFAWMGSPLTAGDKSVGVMVAAANDSDTTFSEEDENFFVTITAYTASIMERHMLKDRLEARARQLSTLNEIGNLLASSLHLKEVLDLVVRNAADLLNTEAGSLLLLDKDSGDLVFRVSSGGAGEKLVGMRIPAGKGIAGAAFSENRPVITQDTHKDRRWYGSVDKRSEFVTEAIIAVPLNARGRTIGVLEVLNRKDGRLFDDEDTELLLSFGAQAAIAIENAQLFTQTDEALQARLEELTRLQHIDRQLNATLDYKEVMGQTLEWAIRITGATIGIIAAVQEDEEGNKGLRFLANKGFPQDLFERYAEDEIWPIQNGLIGKTVQSGETILIEDVSEQQDYQEIVAGMQTQLTVPIKREERVIGVIALESTQAASFTEENVAFIVRLADHAAIAIDNARLFEQVQRANDAKTQFVSFVSHELKQPMTSMKGYAALLMKEIGGPLNDQQKQFLQVIRTNVERMDRLVQDLLDVSRIESGRLRLEMGQVVPEEIVSEAVQAFEQEIATKGQNLQVQIQPNLPTVAGDRGRLIQVLTNLVSNANKYTQEGGKITVGANLWTDNKEKVYVRWSVKDSGIGMTPEDLEKLFTKYFRASNSAVRSVQGTGLGLVITRSIVEMHGGQVAVESQYQQGSTFSFAIPFTEPAQDTTTD